MATVHVCNLVAHVVYVVKVILRLQVKVGLEEEGAQKPHTLFFVVLLLNDGSHVQALLDASEQAFFMVRIIPDLLSEVHEEGEFAEDDFFLLFRLLLLLLKREPAVDMLDYLVEVHVVDPLRHSLRLFVTLSGVLLCQHPLVLQHVSLDQVPVLHFLSFHVLLLSPLFDGLPLLFILQRLYLGERDPHLALLAQHVQQVCLLLLHLKFESADLLLFLLHLLSKLFERVTVGILIIVGVVHAGSLLSGAAVTLWVCEFDFDVDRAAFDRVKTNEDVVRLERLRYLVVGVDEDDVLGEVGLVASALLRLLFLLGDIDPQVFVDQAALLDLGSSILDPAHIVVVNDELGRGVAVLGRHSERHQVLLDYFDAVVLCLSDDGVTVVGWNQAIKQLVHDLDLDIRSLQHLGTVDLF